MKAWRVLLAFVLVPVLLAAGCAVFVRIVKGAPGVAVVHVENRGSQPMTGGHVYLNDHPARALRAPLDSIPAHGSAEATLDDVSGFGLDLEWTLGARGRHKASCGYPDDGADLHVWIVGGDDSLRTRSEVVYHRDRRTSATR